MANLPTAILDLYGPDNDEPAIYVEKERTVADRWRVECPESMQSEYVYSRAGGPIDWDEAVGKMDTKCPAHGHRAPTS
jgi:hypothetical protein